LNDLKDYKRPDTREWRIGDSENKNVSAKLDFECWNFFRESSISLERTLLISLMLLI